MALVMATAPVLILLYDRTFLAGTFREAWRQRARLHLALAATWFVLAALVLVGTFGQIVAYFIFCGLMGLSRLSLGVHFLSDVLGGFVLGLAWLAASTAAFSIWRSEQRKKPVDVMEGVEPEVA